MMSRLLYIAALFPFLLMQPPSARASGLTSADKDFVETGCGRTCPPIQPPPPTCASTGGPAPATEADCCTGSPGDEINLPGGGQRGQAGSPGGVRQRQAGGGGRASLPTDWTPPERRGDFVWVPDERPGEGGSIIIGGGGGIPPPMGEEPGKPKPPPMRKKPVVPGWAIGPAGTSEASLDPTVAWDVSLGWTAGGRPSGRLKLFSQRVLNGYAHMPEGLLLEGGRNLDVVRDLSGPCPGGAIRQVLADECLVDVVASNAYCYAVSFYWPDSAEPERSPQTGEYELKPGAEPYVVYTVENPDEDRAFTRLRVTESRPGAADDVKEFAWEENAHDGLDWTLAEGGGMRVHRMATILPPPYNPDIINVWANDFFLRKLHTTSGADGTLIRSVSKTYTKVNGRVLPTRVAVTGDFEQSMSVGYYQNPDETNRFGRVAVQATPDGAVTYYEYNDLGYTHFVRQAWLGQAPGGDHPSNYTGRVTGYSHAPFLPDGFPLPPGRPRDQGYTDQTTPRVETVTLNGVPVSKTLRTVATDPMGYRHIEEARLLDPSVTNLVAAWQDPANPRTISIYMPEDDFKPCSGDLEKITRPDGSASRYHYTSGTYTPGQGGVPGTFTADAQGVFEGPDFLTTVTHGTTNSPDGIPGRTTQEIIIARKSDKGELLRETWVCVTPGGKTGVYERVAWTAITRDKLGRATMTRRSDGTYTETAWAGTRVAWETGADGVRTDYSYDPLGRVITNSAASLAGPIDSTTVYDAAGRVLSTTVSSGGLSLTSTNAYDLAGRLTWTRSPDGAETAYVYGWLPAGHRYTAVISGYGTPLASTNTTAYHLDGKVAYTGFNGERKTTYAYGVNPGHTQWTAAYEGPAGTNSPVWAVSTRDPLGRTVEQRRPGHGGTVLVTSNAYDTAGRLLATTSSSGGAVHSSTLYSYDGLGQMTLTAQDLNFNGQIDLAGPDRVTASTNAYVKLNGDWWREARQYAYPGGNSATPLLVSTTRTRLTGLGAEVATVTGAALLISDSVRTDALTNATVSQAFLNRAACSLLSLAQSPASTRLSGSIAVRGLTLTNATDTGIVTAYAYDALGRTLTNATVSGKGRAVHTAYAYDTHGRLASVTDATGAATTFAYDELGRRTAVTDTLGQVTHTAYDAENRVTLTHGSTYPVGYEYDTYGRLAAMHTWRDENGAPDTTLWLYEDATGLLTNKVYADGNGPSYAYTPDGRLLTRTWARGTVTTYAYDAAGNLTAVTYSDDTPPLAFTHDRLGRQASAATAGVSTNLFAYSLLGQLTNETVKVAQTFLSADASISRTYDPLGRPASLNVATASLPLELAYSYDTLGRLSTVSSGSGAVHGTYAYLTGTHLLASTTVSNNSGATLTAQRIYEQNRDLIAAIQNSVEAAHGVPAVLVSRFDYENDALGRRTHRIDTGTALDTFPAFGNPNPEASPAFEAYAYNGRSEVTSSARYRGENTADTSKPLHGRARAYAYDAIGNRTQSSDGIPAVVSSYTANALNQYTSRTVPGTLPLTGDAPLDVNVYVNGTLADRQRTHWHGLVTADNTQSPVYAQAEVEAVYLPPDPQDPDEYTATTNHLFFAQSPEAFTYDLDGNLTQDGRFNYSWDARNQLISVVTRDDLPVSVPRCKVEYTYDHGGRRILKQVFTPDNGNWLLGKSSSFAYDRWNVIAETVVDHALQTTNHCSYVWGKDLSGTMQGAGGIGGLLAVIRDDGTYYPCYDANGNVTEYVDGTGAIVAHYEYDPFGNTVAQHGALADSFSYRFSTKYWDAETGLYYYGYRFYKPEWERWINRDPIGERDGINRYNFVKNNPVSWFDPFGLWKSEHKTITTDACNSGLPDEVKDIKKILNMIIAGNTATDKGEDFNDLKLHYNRALDENVDNARKAFSKALKDNTDAFNKKIESPQPTKKDCEEALQILGRLTHMWEDYYAHAIGNDSPHRGDPGPIKGDPDSPSTELKPSSWGGMLSDWGEHGSSDPAKREKDGGKDRMEKATDFVSGKLGSMMPGWWDKCKCYYEKKKK